MKKLTTDDFFERITFSPFHSCWEWAFVAKSKRYGCFGRKLAHRASWEIHKGKIPKYKNVLHTCDNTHCVNPSHLFLGTQKQNVHDMMNKKRGNWAKGIHHGRNKYSEKIIRQIRRSKETGASLSRKYGIAKGLISQIRLRKVWKHLSD